MVTQDVALEHLWGLDYLGESHMLQVDSNRLRRKLEDDHTHLRSILTRAGVGYLLAKQAD